MKRLDERGKTITVDDVVTKLDLQDATLRNRYALSLRHAVGQSIFEALETKVAVPLGMQDYRPSEAAGIPASDECT